MKFGSIALALLLVSCFTLQPVPAAAASVAGGSRLDLYEDVVGVVMSDAEVGPIVQNERRYHHQLRYSETRVIEVLPDGLVAVTWWFRQDGLPSHFVSVLVDTSTRECLTVSIS